MQLMSCTENGYNIVSTALYNWRSLRSKRFQSSYSAKFGAGAKKKMEGGG